LTRCFPRPTGAGFTSSELSLLRTLTEFIEHFHCERNHQGKGNVLLFPDRSTAQRSAGHRMRWRERLGGPLRFYAYAA
jgi:hypothetical protein